MSPVTELLTQFSEGQIELDELAGQLAGMQWPQRPRATPEEAMQGVEPEPDPPGSFAEVEQAFVEGALTANEYRTLLLAVATAGQGAEPELPGEPAAEPPGTPADQEDSKVGTPSEPPADEPAEDDETEEDKPF
jgi:hypothetical protein